MKVFLTDQRARLAKHLEDLKRAPIMPFDIASLRERRYEAVIATRRSLQELDIDFLFEYHIYPGHIMAHLGQWQAEGRRMQAGDTIVQQIYLPPLPPFAQKIICGDRVTDVINGPTRRGFSYATLEGHPERGKATFLFEDRAGQIVFSIHNFSGANLWISRVVAPLFTYPYQEYCNRQGLARVKRLVEERNGG